MTWREIVYMISDELKLGSDDSSFNEDHIAFLVGKYRAFILSQRYKEIRKSIPESNYQTICIDLESTSVLGNPCSEPYLRSTVEIPSTLRIGNVKLFPSNYFQGEIVYVSMDRFRYIGHNKYLQNIIYCAKDADNHLYLKSINPQFMYLQKIRMTAIFENVLKASELECESNNSCNWLDNEFPLEESLVPAVMELVVKELRGAAYSPRDTENNATDDLADLVAFLRRNTKSNLQKQIEG